MEKEPLSPDSDAQPVVQAKLVRAANAASPKPADGLYQRVMRSRLAILATLFCVTGFLGIPLLWMNPHFSTLQRWFWAVVVTVYTCLLIALVCWVVMWSWNSISSHL